MSLNVRNIILISLMTLFAGCGATAPSKEPSNFKTGGEKKDYETIKGTLSIVLSDSYDRKILTSESRFASNIAFVENNTKKLYIFNYGKSNKKVVNQLFEKIKSTGFYDEKSHIAPVFKVFLKVTKEPKIKRGLNSGWQKITKNPFEPHGLVLKEVIKLGVVQKPYPLDCYEKAIPCREK